MGVTVGVNSRTVVHKGSAGKSIAVPDVCLTQVGPAVVPIPYPNIAMSSDIDKTARTVKADGNGIGHEKSVFKKSMGDEAGINKGVASGKVQGKAEFASFSFDVKAEGKGVVRAFDNMIHNDKNTPPTSLIQPPMGSAQAIPEEPVEILETNKVTVKFLDPFGDPLNNLGFETEIDGQKETKKTLGEGAFFYIAKKEKINISIEHERLGLIEKE